MSAQPSAEQAPAQAPPVPRWLRNTELLQFDHPRVRLLALRLTQLKPSAREKAVACHDFVWRLPFGYTGHPSARATEVLQAGMGDGFNKSTLLIALLRAIDIPARARVVALEGGHLRGLREAGSALMEHIFTEVLLEGRWLGVDTYVVDPALGFAARSRLVQEGRVCGWGVHLRGQVGWDGRASSFGRFSDIDARSLPVLDLGAFDDVQAFRASDPGGRYGVVPDHPWRIAAALANRRIRKLRQSALVQTAGEGATTGLSRP